MRAFAAELARLGVRDGETLVVAVSGGPDSMALLHLAGASAPTHDWRIVVAHLDHALRSDSADDARFVQQAAGALGLEVVVERTDVAALARERGEGVEEAGRVARYALLARVAQAAGGEAWILTGHTADDQAETVLLHLARGTGLAGIAGIAERRDRVVRPLLGMRRGELRAALERAGIAYRSDPSNDDDAYARNRARKALLPVLAALHPSAVTHLARTARLTAADDHLLDAIASGELARRRSADGWIEWRNAPPAPLAARLVRLAVGPPAPTSERTAAVVAAASGGRGGRSIELGHGRMARIRNRRVRILQER